jgi:Zn-dependent membrane protease YugP
MMHPVLVLLPALGLIIGPRLWVQRELRIHDDEDAGREPASAVARGLLDDHGLQAVRVEWTDVGDHYDPEQRCVRLARHNFDRRSLAAITTAAHEVAHAIQDASGYPPFRLRMQLAQLARVAGTSGSVLLLAVPVTYLLTRQPLPRTLVGGAALGLLSTSAAAQIAALPSELDASFGRALPMLRRGYLADHEVAAARRILAACSLTYVASSFASVLHLWPWIGPRRVPLRPDTMAVPAVARGPEPVKRPSARVRRPPWEPLLRRVAKPFVRGWLTARAHTQH